MSVMRSQWLSFISVFICLLTVPAASQAADPSEIPRRFADNLYQLHQHIMSQHDVRTESEIGGYGGLRGDPNFYKEVRYFDKENDRLLSMIQWENKSPDNIHTIELNIYDQAGRVVRDYTAAYLPNSRNAPFQTLIGLRHFDKDLSGYRQYDAAGNVLFEDCSGTLDGKKFRIVLEYHEIPDDPRSIEDATERAAYPICFNKLPKNPGKYLNPMVEASAK